MDPSEQDQTIDIRIAVHFEAEDVSMPKLRELVTAVCNRFGRDTDPNTPYQIGIAIVGDAEIKELNARFLDHETTTDCLSFDLSESGEKSRVFELVVNGEMAARQAKSLGHSNETELALYIAHGLLHNLGFDDSTASLAREMHATEDDILQELGYGFVYNGNSRTPEH